MIYNCELMEDLLSPYLDQVLDADSKALCEKHLQECADCREVCRQMTAVSQACLGVDDEPPAGLRAAILAAATGCASAREKIALAVDGGADEETGAHLAACPSCAAELEKLQSLHLLVRASGEVQPPAGLRDKIAQKTYAASHLRSAPMWVRFGRQWAVAGAAVCVAIVALTAWQLNQAPVVQEREEASSRVVSSELSPAAERAADIARDAVARAGTAVEAPARVASRDVPRRSQKWRTNELPGQPRPVELKAERPVAEAMPKPEPVEEYLPAEAADTVSEAEELPVRVAIVPEEETPVVEKRALVARSEPPAVSGQEVDREQLVRMRQMIQARQKQLLADKLPDVPRARRVAVTLWDTQF